VNLVLRGVARDAATAALATTAALRALEAAGVDHPAVWIAHGTTKLDATAAWDHGIALIRVGGGAAEASARGVVEATGARLVLGGADIGRVGRARGDGARLAARHELGVWPDEQVEVILGADRDPAGLDERLDDFDRRGEQDTDTARRLIVAALSSHGPAVSTPMLRAILHPLVLVEVSPSDQSTMELIRLAAQDVQQPTD